MRHRIDIGLVVDGGAMREAGKLRDINDGAAALKKRIAANLSTFSVAGSDGSIKS